jgi:hypothetical protein
MLQVRRILVGAFFAVSLVGPAAAADDPAVGRVHWLYNQGSFTKQADGSWLQVRPGKKYRYREVEQTAKFIALYDKSRDAHVHLHAARLRKWSKTEEKWVAGVEGRWEEPWKQPLDANRDAEQREKVAQVKKDFPRLGGLYEVMGPSTKGYNCIAWSIGVTDRWVWPGETVADFDRLYGQEGYRRVKGLPLALEENRDRIVLYGKTVDGTVKATHAARQLEDGSWSSKLGAAPLIRHLDARDVDGVAYGDPLAVYVRGKRGESGPAGVDNRPTAGGADSLVQLPIPVLSRRSQRRGSE